MKLSEFPNMVQVRSAKEFLTDFLINGQQFCDAVEEMEYVGRVIRFDLLHYTRELLKELLFDSS